VSPTGETKLDAAGRIGLFVLLAVAVYLVARVFSPFVTAILWAVFLATAFAPAYRFALRVFRGKRWTASIVLTVLVAAVVIAPTIFVLTKVVGAIGENLPKLEAKYQEVVAPSADEPSAPSQASTLKERILTELEKYTIVTGLDLKKNVLQIAQKAGQVVAQKAGRFLQNVAHAFFTLLLLLVVLAAVFRYGPAIKETITSILPLPEDDRRELFTRLKNVAEAVFYGVILTALVQAHLGALGWWFTGLPSPILFGFLMFFCAFIPVGGVALVWVPGAVYLFWHGDFGMGVVMTIWGALAVSGIDNVLRPIFIKGRTGLPLLLVLLSMVGGLLAFGVTGLFLGPLSVTLLLHLLEILRRDLA